METNKNNMTDFVGTLTSFADADKLAEQFEAVMTGIGVTIRGGGPLEALCLELRELAEFHARTLVPERGLDLRQQFRHAVGLRHLLMLTLRCEHQQELRKFAPHFDLLNTGTPLQNVTASPNDPSANKVLELVVGLATLTFADAVNLDPPENSKGDNPDVLADFNGNTWGLACKVPNGTSAITLFDRVEEGVKQIENSGATIGLVVLNFKNVFPHAEVFPEMGRDDEGDLLLGVHSDHSAVVCHMKEFAEEKLRKMCEHATAPEIEKLFAGKKSLPGVLVIAETTIGVRLEGEDVPQAAAGKPMPTLVGFVHLIQLADDQRWNEEVTRFLSGVNAGFHGPPTHGAPPPSQGAGQQEAAD